ncbi:hypothetical protein BOH72_23645 [Mycobacterium sp. WY10]|nr:hypothetical protein BOH72_23645 [Mycobacterium sp. WY10]
MKIGIGMSTLVEQVLPTAAGSARFNPHRSRSSSGHRIAAHLCLVAVSGGANVSASQRMLGHRSGEVILDVCADLFDSDLGDAASSLEAVCTPKNAAVKSRGVVYDAVV